jgi:hypothetical protein
VSSRFDFPFSTISLTNIAPAYSANPDQHSTHNIDGPSKPTAKDFREQLKERKQRLAAAKANFVQSMDKLNEELVYLRNDA